jgi:phage replication-related protein YjqB (UPF0714/DUF867 family)
VFADLLRQPGVVERMELRSSFGFMAFHGGLEAGTELVAGAAAEAADASLYAVVQPPDLIWHIPSSRVSPNGSECLARFLGHVDVVVAVHGYGRQGRPLDLLLGGRNRPLAAALGRHLRSTMPGFTIVDDIDDIPVELRGLNVANPVNRPTLGGVQLELPPRARGTSADPRLRHEGCAPVDGVVAGLAATAERWTAAHRRSGGHARRKVGRPQET